MKRHLKLLHYLILAILLAGSSSACADISEARDVLLNTVYQIYSDLDGSHSTDDELRAAAEEVIRSKVIPLLNVEMFSKLILASHWKKTSPEQRAKFQDVLTGFLIRTFAQAIASDHDRFDEFLEQMSVESARPGRNENRAVVPMSIMTDTGVVTLDFRMARNESDWLLYDLVFQGVSFAINYRTILKSEIRKHGIDKVTEDLEAKLSI